MGNLYVFVGTYQKHKAEKRVISFSKIAYFVIPQIKFIWHHPLNVLAGDTLE
jgi:hypothetical protein